MRWKEHLRGIGKSMLLAALTIAATAASADNGAALRQVSGSVYVFESADYVATTYVIYVGKRGVIVAGATWTPATARKLHDAIKAVTDRPVTDVVYISPDPEWSGGNAYWESVGAQVLAVRATADLLGTGWRPTTDFAKSHSMEFPSGEVAAPTKIVPNEFALQDGAVKLLFLGASHTPGDVFVYFPNEKILDAGSILKEQLGNLANADLSEYPRTLERLRRKNLDVTVILSGHWSPLHGPELIGDYLDLLRAASKR